MLLLVPLLAMAVWLELLVSVDVRHEMIHMLMVYV